MRIAVFTIIGAGLALSACATTSSGSDDYYAAQLDSPYQDQSRIKTMLPEEIAPAEVQYDCDDDTTLRVRYYGSAVASAVLPQISSTRAYLEGRVSDDGVAYTAGPLEIYRDDDGILVSDGDDLDIVCLAEL